MKKILLSILSVLCVLSVNATDFTLVKSADQLAAGKKYIIVATEYDYAMSTEQKTNNRGQDKITKNGEIISISSDMKSQDFVQVFTLENGAIDGTWAFYAPNYKDAKGNVKNGYLYAASSSSNNLKSTDTKSDNASATIEIDGTTGVATIIFQGSNTRNKIQYNQSSSLFSCYATDKPQKDVSLYVEVEASGEEPGEENATLSIGNISQFATVLGENQTQTITILASNLTEEITITLTDESGKFSVNTTTLTLEGGEIEITYNGSSAGSTTASLKVSCGELSAESEISAFTTSNSGTKENPLSVTDVVNLNNALSGSYWVIGTIGGYYNNKYKPGAEDAVDTNIALIENDFSIPVQLPSGDIRTALNLIDHADYIGATVSVYGSLEAYYSSPGVKNVTDYVLDEKTTGVEDTMVDENASVEYYNLQGVKVARPENGIFIKKQGAKATKVVL